MKLPFVELLYCVSVLHFIVIVGILIQLKTHNDLIREAHINLIKNEFETTLTTKLFMEFAKVTEKKCHDTNERLEKLENKNEPTYKPPYGHHYICGTQ